MTTPLIIAAVWLVAMVGVWAFVRGATQKPSIPVDPLVKVYSADGSEVYVRESRIATSSSGSLDA